MKAIADAIFTWARSKGTVRHGSCSCQFPKGGARCPTRKNTLERYLGGSEEENRKCQSELRRFEKKTRRSQAGMDQCKRYTGEDACRSNSKPCGKPFCPRGVSEVRESPEDNSLCSYLG